MVPCNSFSYHLPFLGRLSKTREPSKGYHRYLVFRGAVAQFEQIGEDITVARSGKLHTEALSVIPRGLTGGVPQGGAWDRS